MSVSGLKPHQRHIARELALQSMQLVLAHPGAVHYTQGPERWDGIDLKLDPRKGQYPKHGDCSSTTTWALWVALHLRFGLADIVNGDRWEGGYTGTMAQHGRQVQRRDNAIRGDLVLYGPAPAFEHVVMVEGWWHDKCYVISHGSEAGPFELPIDYRGDIGQIRRYI